jgi:hypothetical protein
MKIPVGNGRPPKVRYAKQLTMNDSIVVGEYVFHECPSRYHDHVANPLPQISDFGCRTTKPGKLTLEPWCSECREKASKMSTANVTSRIDDRQRRCLTGATS